MLSPSMSDIRSPNGPDHLTPQERDSIRMNVLAFMAERPAFASEERQELRSELLAFTKLRPAFGGLPADEPVLTYWSGVNLLGRLRPLAV